MLKIFLIGFCFFSFTLHAKVSWEAFKSKVLLEKSHLSGWCSNEKAEVMMDLVKKNGCQCCVEIGVFSGASLFPIVKALQYNGSGIAYAIDAWDPVEATKGFLPSDPNYIWWNQINFEDLYNQVLKLIKKNNLSRHCKIIKKNSQAALSFFADGTIDFLHLDGNHNEKFAFEDVISYFPKVKEGGYIVLNDPNWMSMMQSLVFLLERSEIVSPFSSSMHYLVLRKNGQYIDNAKILLRNAS